MASNIELFSIPIELLVHILEELGQLKWLLDCRPVCKRFLEATKKVKRVPREDFLIESPDKAIWLTNLLPSCRTMFAHIMSNVFERMQNIMHHLAGADIFIGADEDDAQWGRKVLSSCAATMPFVVCMDISGVDDLIDSDWGNPPPLLRHLRVARTSMTTFSPAWLAKLEAFSWFPTLNQGWDGTHYPDVQLPETLGALDLRAATQLRALDYQLTAPLTSKVLVNSSKLTTLNIWGFESTPQTELQPDFWSHLLPTSPLSTNSIFDFQSLQTIRTLTLFNLSNVSFDISVLVALPNLRSFGCLYSLAMPTNYAMLLSIKSIKELQIIFGAPSRVSEEFKTFIFSAPMVEQLEALSADFVPLFLCYSNTLKRLDLCSARGNHAKVLKYFPNLQSSRMAIEAFADLGVCDPMPLVQTLFLTANSLESDRHDLLVASLRHVARAFPNLKHLYLLRMCVQDPLAFRQALVDIMCAEEWKQLCVVHLNDVLFMDAGHVLEQPLPHCSSWPLDRPVPE